MTYEVRAKIAAPWHIYKYAATPAKTGPQLTSFDFFDTAGLAIDKSKGWTASAEPTKKKEPPQRTDRSTSPTQPRGAIARAVCMGATMPR